MCTLTEIDLNHNLLKSIVLLIITYLCNVISSVYDALGAMQPLSGFAMKYLGLDTFI